MSDLYAVIGHPIKQSMSPLIHTQFARQTGEDIRYGRLDCVTAKFVPTIEKFFGDGGRGLNVTAPHKKRAFTQADRVGIRARNAGAVNVLTADANGEIVGENTDGTGMVRDLTQNLRFKLEGSRILIIGAGGSARGIIAPLAREKPAVLTVTNRTHGNAMKLVESFSGLADISACRIDKLKADYDLVIHATAAGLKNRVPLLDGAIVRQADCYDLMYARTETPFMQWAQRQGAKSVTDGWGMLVEQAAESFNIWRGVWPDTALLLAARPSASRRDKSTAD